MNQESILKSKDITLLTKVCLVKTMVLLVVMYGCDGWTTNKAEHRRIDAFKFWYWKRLLRVLWTEQRSKQSIPKAEHSLEGLMLKLNSNTLVTWCKEPTYCRRPRSWERLKAGGEGATEDEMVGWHHWLNGCGEPVRHSTRDKGHEEGGSAYAKAGASFRSPPGNSRAYTPKTRDCLLYCFVLSPLTLLGAVPYHHLSLSVSKS